MAIPPGGPSDAHGEGAQPSKHPDAALASKLFDGGYTRTDRISHRLETAESTTPFNSSLAGKWMTEAAEKVLQAAKFVGALDTLSRVAGILDATVPPYPVMAQSILDGGQPKLATRVDWPESGPNKLQRVADSREAMLKSATRSS